MQRKLDQFTKSVAVSLLALTGALVLNGCTTSDELAALSEQPSYYAGFGDGCQTSSEADKSFSTKRIRDDFAFKDDRAYRAGWRSGLLQCDYERNDDPTRSGGLLLGKDQNF